MPLDLFGIAVDNLPPLVPSLRMSGTILLLSLHAFIAMTRKYYLVL